MPARPPLSCLLHVLQRELWQRRLPHGLLGPRYLWPWGDPRVRIHRQLWWLHTGPWPRPLWLLLQAWLWLRWTLFLALPACVRALRLYGPEVQAEEHIALHLQGWRLAKLALLWCIPPGEAYRFRLYRDPRQALGFVFQSESPAYHAWRSQPLGWTRASRQRLQDKAQLATQLHALGVPMAATVVQVPQTKRVATGHPDTAPLLAAVQQHRRVFCKLNSSNQGHGAFSAWAAPQGLAGQAFSGQALPDTPAVLAAWQNLLALGDALVQPGLTNHTALAPLACNAEAITVRCITQWDDGAPGQPPSQLSCLSATLEVPAGHDPQGRVLYALLPIHPATGAIAPPLQGPSASASLLQAMARVAVAAQGLHTLPGWPELLAGSWRAHRPFTDIRAIAWDWVITPDGPVLLEGNTGWGTAWPQLQTLSGLPGKNFVP